MEEWAQLLKLLVGVVLDDRDDKKVWLLENYGTFSVNPSPQI